MSKIKMGQTIKSCALILAGITGLITGVLGSPIHEVMALTINTVDELKNPSTGLCLDSFGKIGNARMNTCHGIRGNQEWQS